jgi:hypothetical protein
MSAIRALLQGIVDYAGLFPPATLDMSATVENYARYRGDDAAWMLGRIVVPVSRFDEFEAATSGMVDITGWRISAIVGSDFAAEFESISAFNKKGSAVVDMAEIRAGDVETIAKIAAHVPAGVRAFVEIPVEEPGELIRAISSARLRAKIRTGGVTADAFPGTAQVTGFIRACYGAGVAFKATAGLHHPLRCEHRLTYEPDSPRGIMHGFLNVFLAAAFCYNGLGAVDAPRVIELGDLSGVRVNDEGIAWEGYSLSTSEVATARRRLAVSFGSCSFTEPVDDLKQLQLI